MKRRTTDLLALILALVGCLMVSWQLGGSARVSEFRAALTPSATFWPTHPPERLVPTLPSTPPTPLPWTPPASSTAVELEPSLTATRASTPVSTSSSTSSPTPRPEPSPDPSTTTPAPAAADPGPSPRPTSTLTAAPTATELPGGPPADQWRFGVVSRQGGLASFDLGALRAGWLLGSVSGLTVPPGTELVHAVVVQGDAFWPEAERLRSWVAASPGAVWQVGNEPDVIWQSNCTPGQYALVYHQVYSLIKEVDPAARVAGGVLSQPTPLRLQYLDLVLGAYQELYGEPMPVDIWAVHNSILREERGSWGVDIPPGLGANTGRLYEINDNDRLDLFRRQLVDFRTWMRDRGYRDRPLYLTEFSILMPAEYGFPPERVIAFMTGAFDWLLSAADGGLGYPADGGRLVQRWAWYSLADTGEPGHYPTGNLFDPVTGEMTAVGRAFAAYLLGR